MNDRRVRFIALVPLLLCVTSFISLHVAVAGQIAGSFSATGEMTAARESHAAAVLPNGSVLIAGGYEVPLVPPCCNFVPESTAEIYDPSTELFTATGSMTVARGNAIAVTLPNGKVLVTDGITADAYDPSSGSFSATASPNFSKRVSVQAILLKTGRVLLTDGTSAELYDPSSGTLAATGPPQIVRTNFSATLLNDGRVLIAGGCCDGGAFSSAELYDPSTGVFSLTGSMMHARFNQVAALVGGSTAQAGDVLVVGGSNFRPPPGGPNLNVQGAELYNPATEQFTLTSSSQSDYEPTFGFGATATTLPDGRVVIAGGVGTNDAGGADNPTTVYDPSASTFRQMGKMIVARAFHSATLLASGEVLIAGGDQGGIPNRPGCCTTLSTGELFNPFGSEFVSDVQLIVPQGYALTGTVPVLAFAAPDVQWVNFYLDASYLRSTPPFSFSLDTTTLSDGSHTLLAAAFTGNPQRTSLGSDSVVVKIANHGVSIAQPLQGQPESGQCVELEVPFFPPIYHVRNYLDGHYQNSSRHSCIKIAHLKSGLHTLSTIGFGRSSRRLGSDSVRVHIANPPGDNAVIASPPSGSGASATITVMVAAHSNVRQVNLYIDGNFYASAPPFSFQIDTTKLSNGPHTISLQSYNITTRQATSDEIVINTVN